MGVEVRPLGVRCNISCTYCYQNPEREAGNVARRYDLGAIKDAILAEGEAFSLFGGEPLLVPIADLEDLFRFGFENFGRNNIQTNASLLRDEHVRLFRQYNVHVGVSIDGPGELNDARWAGSSERTRQTTANVEVAIERLCREGLTPSLIVTLHRGNASAERLPTLMEWIRTVVARGVRSLRLHLLEVEDAATRATYALHDEENIAALRAFLALEAELPDLRLDIFDDMRRMLLGQDDRTTCVWNGCDPYTTHAVRGIEGSGQRSNCGRTNKDGIDFVKADVPGFERYLALYHTPQAHGGCRDCRFFLMCKGQCPGTAIDGDWRNRTEHCEVWKSLYEVLEAQASARGFVPLSQDPRRRQVEAEVVSAWCQGRATTIASARMQALLRSASHVGAT